MKFKRYLTTLLLVPVLLFTAKSYARNEIEDTYQPTGNAIRPFLVEVVNQDGTTLSVSGGSREDELSEIVDDLDVILFPEDRLSSFPDLFMEMGGKITVRRAPVINLVDGKKKMFLRSWAGTVEELLQEKSIELGADDKISPALTSTIGEGSEIKINRVAVTTVVETQDLPFKHLEKNDPDMKYGRTRTERGAAGARELTFLVTRIDGEEVSRVLQSSKVTLEPKDEIKYIGTKVKVISSVSGRATIGPDNCEIVSANYRKGTLVRITNLSGRASIIGAVDCTWGTATAPSGIVLDLSEANLARLKWNGLDAGPSVLVEEIE